MKKLLFVSFCILSLQTIAQKKPLDHSVYDGWQSIADRSVSNDGKYVVYAVNPQEGDGTLYVQSATGDYKKEIARGYGAVITEDSRYVICRIKPTFKDTRDGKIKKKKALSSSSQMPPGIAHVTAGNSRIQRNASCAIVAPGGTSARNFSTAHNPVS